MFNTREKSIRGEVLDAIKSGKVYMRPRWHFVLRALLALFGLFILACALLYLVSFVLFVFRENEIWLLPAFGYRGLKLWLWSLPKFLIFLSLVFIALLEILARKYAFGYRKPLLVTVGGIIGFVLLASIALARWQFHERFFSRARHGDLPIVGSFYRGYGMSQNNYVHPGTIKEVTDEGFIMESKNGGTISVAVDPETSFPLGVDFEKGDRVLVVGEKRDDEIRASGIRKVDGEHKNRMRRGGWFRPLR